jgi:acetyltransferase-like isoleucine patch superfamily enzyme
MSYILILCIFLPHPIKISIYRHLFRWKIGNNVRIGLSYIQANQISLDDNTVIGNFNIINRLNKLEIGCNSQLGNFNQIFYSGLLKDRLPDESAILRIGDRSVITSHHFIDLDGVVEIGNDTVIGGRDSQVWTHQWIQKGNHLEKTRQKITVGNNVYVGSRTTLLNGCTVPDKAMIGACSVVNKQFQPEDNRLLIAGNPANIRKRYLNEDDSS